MKSILRSLFLALCIAFVLIPTFAQVGAVRYNGSTKDIFDPAAGFNLPSGFTLTAKSGSSITFASGSAFNFSAAMVTLPASVVTLTGTQTVTGKGLTGVTALGLRSTGTGAFDLTLANTENLTAARTLTLKVNDAARTVDLGGNLALAGAFATSGAFSGTLTLTGATNVTLPTTGTLATLAGSESFSNKTLISPIFSTSIVLPNGSSVTTSAVGNLAFDTDAWAASRGALQLTDGTASTYVVAALASDTPTNGQVPTWNTGGTVTWETPTGGGGTPGGSDTQMQYNNGGSAFGGTASFTYNNATQVLTYSKANTANTSVDGLALVNSTTASSGNQGQSPRLRLTGNGWKTTATAASQSTDWVIENKPVQGTTAPTSQLIISSQINGAGYAERLNLDSAGTLYLGAITAGTLSSASGAVSVTAQGTNQNITLTPSGTTGYVSVPGSTTTATFRVGTFTMQGYALNNAFFGENSVYNGSGDVYIATGFANRIQFSSGDVFFRTAISGTAGGAITWIEGMKLVNAGRVLIGTITDDGSNKLQVAGTAQATGFIKSTSATGGIGYATGAGGAQTQATDKSTTVTSNTVTTAITMNAAALNTNTRVSFTFTNSTIAATDTVIAHRQSAGTDDSYSVSVDKTAAGSCRITVWNYSGGSLSEAIVLRVTVIKSVSS